MRKKKITREQKEVIAMYSNLIKQISNKVGKKVDIYDPYGSENIVVNDYKVTRRMLEICVRRKSCWLGEKI